MAKAPNASPSNSKQITTIMIILVCASVIFGIKFFKDYKRDQVLKMNTMKVKGNKNAPIKIVEYIDFQCPACATGAKMIKEYMEAHPDQIYLEMKYYPLAMHAHAFTSSQYAECALKQGKFWEFHDLLIGRQAMWSVMPDVKSTFDAMAEELKLNMKELKSCVDDPKTNETVLKSRSEGDLLGIKSTPSYLVNDKFIVGYKNLKDELDSIVNKEKK